MFFIPLIESKDLNCALNEIVDQFWRLAETVGGDFLDRFLQLRNRISIFGRKLDLQDRWTGDRHSNLADYETLRGDNLRHRFDQSRGNFAGNDVVDLSH